MKKSLYFFIIENIIVYENFMIIIIIFRNNKFIILCFQFIFFTIKILFRNNINEHLFLWPSLQNYPPLTEKINLQERRMSSSWGLYVYLIAFKCS